MKKYTLYRNRHYSHIFPSIHFRRSHLSFDFMFSKSCLYHFFDEDNEDINKLYGHSFGIDRHIDSFRIGWSCSKNNNKIQLYSYYYNKGIREFVYICEVQTNIRANCHIYFDRTDNHIYVTIQMGAESFQTKIPFIFTDVPRWGFRMCPYFGGNKPAPHDMNIFIHEQRS